MNRKAIFAICAALAAASALLGTYTVYDESMAPVNTPEPTAAPEVSYVIPRSLHGVKQLLAGASDEKALDAFIAAIREPLQDSRYSTLMDILFDIKENLPEFGILSSEEEFRAVFDGTSIYLSTGAIENEAAGTILHELCHVILSFSNDYYNMPTAYLAVSSQARNRLVNEKLPAVEDFFARLNEYRENLIADENYIASLGNFVQTSGFRATGGIITSLFGTREIPIDDEGGTLLLCSYDIDFGHDDDYFIPHTSRPYIEQIAYFFELKLTNNVTQLDFLKDVLGDDWFALMESEFDKLLVQRPRNS